MNILLSAMLVGFISGIVGGCCIYLLVHWSHVRFQLGLDYRLSDLEGRVTREVKIRGLAAADKSKNWEKDFMEKIKVEKPEETLTLESWKAKAYKR